MEQTVRRLVVAGAALTLLALAAAPASAQTDGRYTGVTPPVVATGGTGVTPPVVATGGTGVTPPVVAMAETGVTPPVVAMAETGARSATPPALPFQVSAAAGSERPQASTSAFAVTRADMIALATIGLVILGVGVALTRRPRPEPES